MRTVLTPSRTYCGVNGKGLKFGRKEELTCKKCKRYFRI